MILHGHRIRPRLPSSRQQRDYRTVWNSVQNLFARIAIVASVILSAPAAAQDLAAFDRHDAVILIYHRFGEPDLPSTNIRTEQFEAQLAALAAGDYSVLPLADIVRAFADGSALPEKAVAITVDDAYRSFADTAWPLLRKYGFPATLFVATDPVDEGFSRYLDWETIRRLHREGVAIGHHGAAHLHLIDAGIDAARADIARASERFRAELGFVPDLFAYPYGEYSRDLAELVHRMGFTAAMAQYSGVAAAGGDRFALPRFPLNEHYSTPARFRLIVNARALPVTDVLPSDTVLTPASNPPAYGFTLTTDIPGLRALACYPSHSGPAAITFLPGRRVEVRVDRPFPKGRGRINCTLPGGDRRWFWLGRFFYVPKGEQADVD
ncbi:MAG: chitin deacetylase [Alphaproteobacteria bacterium]|nr:MAG: chitin deacetylase [Alphaproteobacteria bacterium]